ncbi:TldD/PmbA family protein, partial [Methanocorpusculum sp.]|nr:TldD/PmbA family protein [Methanocorpusculum sp.]
MDKVRYYDIRCVNGDTTSIQIENGSVENAGSSYYGKALIRVLGENGWGYCCVSPFDMDDAKAKEAAIEKAARSARRATVKADIADVPYGTPRSWNASAKEQAERPLEEKAADLLLLEKAARIDEIAATSARYAEQYQTVYFEDCNGYEAESSVCRTLFTVSSVAVRGADMQMNYEQEAVVGPLRITDYIKKGELCSKTAVDLLSASAVPGGKMPAVLDPAIGGVFAHEAVGHASEGDQIRDGVSVLGDKLGMQVGSKLVTIIDDPSMHGYGYEPFDAEGVAAGPVELIKNG